MGNLSQHTKHRGVRHPRRHIPVIYTDGDGQWWVRVRWSNDNTPFLMPFDTFSEAVAKANYLCFLNTILAAA
jgi:hypothetical protein